MFHQRMLETKDSTYKVFLFTFPELLVQMLMVVSLCKLPTIHDNDEAPHGTLMKTETEAYTGKDDPKLYSIIEKRVRSEMLKGIDPEICKLCTQEENNGIGSRRTGSKK